MGTEVSGSKIRIATFNVHSFADAKGKDSFDRIVKLIESYKIDILCLQEAGKWKIRKLLADLKDMNEFVERSNCVILSKFPIRQIDCHSGRKKKHWPRYVTSLIQISENLTLNITSLHLNHRLETFRTRELETIMCDLYNSKYLAGNIPKIVAGDFNALTLEDYGKEELENIERIRRGNKWEKPMRHITDSMKEKFFDARKPAKVITGLLSTCRFNTRIDYIFIDENFRENAVVNNFTHVDDAASDHNMVIADIVLTYRNN